MNTKKELLYKELTYQLVGCCYSVYNELGPGYKESVYHKALVIEFENNKMGFCEEERIPITYCKKNVGTYVPDFIVEDKIIVEIKAVDIMPQLFETQLYSYLKGTEYKLGYLINFGSNKIDIRRRIHDTAKKNKLAEIRVQKLARICVTKKIG